MTELVGRAFSVAAPQT